MNQVVSDFFVKYRQVPEDNSGDSRGVFGKMDKLSCVPYDKFSEDIGALPGDFPFLVHYYHPEKPYYWITKNRYPPTEPYGPAPDDKPWIIRRHPSWYPVPKAMRNREDILVFTILKWEFEVTLIFFEGKLDLDSVGAILYDGRFGGLYNEGEVSSHVADTERVKHHEPN